MNDLKGWRWTGVFGLAVVVLRLIEFPLRVLTSGGKSPPREETLRDADYVTKTNGIMLTIILVDMFMMACILVFLAGFCHLIRQARSEYEGIGTLVFGTGLVLVAITLVTDSLAARTALDTVAGCADPVFRTDGRSSQHKYSQQNFHGETAKLR